MPANLINTENKLEWGDFDGFHKIDSGKPAFGADIRDLNIDFPEIAELSRCRLFDFHRCNRVDFHLLSWKDFGIYSQMIP